jgi:Flp pilus assembly protein TadD
LGGRGKLIPPFLFLKETTMEKEKFLDELYTHAQFKMMEGELDEGVKICSEILAKDCKYTKALQARAIGKLRLGDPEGALEDIQQSICCEPENSRFYYHKGTILFQTGRLEEAFKELTKAIELDPKYPAPYTVRAKIFEMNGDIEASNADMEQAIKLRNEQSEVMSW